MRYFANPSTESVRRSMRAGQLGMITTPAQGNRLLAGVVWCADNGCFGKGYPGDKAWLAWLDSFSIEERARCAFATAPDVVGDAAATLARSTPWLPRIRALGFPAAFVAQDGSERVGMVPWDEVDVIFIGGSTAWKLSDEAAEVVVEAKRRGKAVHCGRVNSLRRMRRMVELGVDSCDGTFIAFGPDRNLPQLLMWLHSVNHHA